MFERFTQRARMVVVEAQNEAREHYHEAVSPDHLVAGIIREGEGMAAMILENGGFTLEQVRESLLRKYARGPEITVGQIPFDESAKRALELALRETVSLGHDWIGTEHLLLGLSRLEENAVFTFEEAEALRAETIRLLSGSLRTLELRPARPAWVKVDTPSRCLAGFSLFGANFHCQSAAGHDPAEGHVEHGDGWTMRWEA